MGSAEKSLASDVKYFALLDHLAITEGNFINNPKAFRKNAQ